MPCPKCGEGEVVVKRTKTGRNFYGCSRYPECDFASWSKPGVKKEKIGRARQRLGPNDVFGR